MAGRRILRFFTRVARSPLGRRFMGWGFTHMSFAMPVQRLRETDTLIAFYHPQPSYAVHILLVPKKALAGVSELALADAGFLVDLFQTVQDLVRELGLGSGGYRLIVNGGKYQEVPQLHFHLVSDV